MSLNSLASNRVASEISVAARSAKVRVASEDTVGPNEQDVQNALSALVEYVPAETVTLYLAVIASLPTLKNTIPRLSAESVYWVFGLLTPLMFALIYMGKRHGAGQPRTPGVKLWPWWPMIASAIAFFAWGLVVPDGPYLTSDAGRVFGSLVAIIVSTLIGVVGRLFVPRQN